MAGYFAVRKRNASAKYRVEVVTVLLAFALSFIVKASILLINDHETFSDGLNSILQALYFTIGGLAFDGIEMSVAGMSFINCLYMLYINLLLVISFANICSHLIHCILFSFC